MAIFEVKVSAIDVDKVKTLIELISRYQDKLPKKLLAQLKICQEAEHCELGVRKLNSMAGDGEFKCVADGKEIDRVTKINPVLKCVYYVGEANKGKLPPEHRIYPKKLKATSDDDVLVEW